MKSVKLPLKIYFRYKRLETLPNYFLLLKVNSAYLYNEILNYKTFKLYFYCVINYKALHMCTFKLTAHRR